MPNVAFVRSEIKQRLVQYTLIDDCLAGQERIKSRHDLYLPRPNPEDVTAENVKRYGAYKRRAVFYNVSQRTLAGLVGQIFMRDPLLEAPTALEAVIADADGSGISLEQSAKKAAALTIGHGRCGLFVDYPDTEAPASAQDLTDGKIRPTIRVIKPNEAINWRTVVRGAKTILSLVVFSEEYIDEDDGFETKTKVRWRALRLDEADEYYVEVYEAKQGEPTQRYYPLDSTGARFNEIPFTFIGSESNDPSVDAPPLYDLCELNVAHYRNSADYEESVFLIGQPTLFMSGMTQEWVNDVLKGTVYMGSRAGLPGPAGSDAKLLQAAPNMLAKEAMEHKEGQMIALGAKLVEASQTQRTATEADIDNVSETSVLGAAAKNVGAAFKWALEVCCRFVGAPDNAIAYDLNTEFDLVNLSPEERKQLIAEWVAGAIAFEEMRDNLRRGGVASLSDAVAKTKIAAEMDDAAKRAVAEMEAMTEVAKPAGDEDEPVPGAS